MKKVTNTMRLMLITNLILSFLQIIVGIFGNSSAIIADGVHTITDLITDMVAIIGTKFSNKRPDEKHPFGYGQIEYITSVFIGIIIVLMGISLMVGTLNTNLVIPKVEIIIVTILTIVVKYFMSQYVILKGKEYKNAILIASGKESVVDVLSSVIVLFSIVFMQFSNKINFLIYSDKIAAFLVSIFVIKTGLNIISQDIANLIGKQEQDEQVLNEIKNIILKDEKILEIEKIILIKSGPYYKLDAKVLMQEDLTLKTVGRSIIKIKNNLKKNLSIKFVNIIVDAKK